MNLALCSGTAESALEAWCLRHSSTFQQACGQDWRDQSGSVDESGCQSFLWKFSVIRILETGGGARLWTAACSSLCGGDKRHGVCRRLGQTSASYFFYELRQISSC